ncbi:hypothetical protein [Erinnyis ello granulovirus]|uniref:Uncharacterized protein n=1 Tax=Erinnyis ello granulovirus TaxID=307444 RepID=A0A097DAJ9_9BBAC|nr:hypothetical protein [Erinnyis ello granulovirus]AIS92049.1 hypothetical protein [Erinnyis ello granulovirus]ARX71388.1 hypothetical protein EREL_049 [Erinnyis ello granulovirus]ARX71518.1 hypothetical protein EREL_049 [Erinnyis ello granulovirus]ARX71648.1 hypothetical protein EREL_049 [Erinnyis ello granulovirus]ARX71778.1 hypothetical protein EREL_049 [Erinnyis ello granulovirus]
MDSSTIGAAITLFLPRNRQQKRVCILAGLQLFFVSINMDNFDQLDTIIKDNQVLIQQVVLFIVSVTLIFIVCSLLYVVYTYDKQKWHKTI